MKCLVLGGGGFIGSHVVDALLERGHRVRVFERPRVPQYRAPDGDILEWMEGDFQNAARVREAVQGVDTIVHLVSTTLPKGSNDDPEFDVQSNVIGSLRLLRSAVEAGVRKLVFISSGGTVYGVPVTIPIPETHATEPRVSYAIGKLAVEKYLAVFRQEHGLDSVVLRVANPYGPRQRVDIAQGAVAVFLDAALAGRDVEIWGDGSVVRDYVHVADVARAFVLALEYGGSEHVFNIGSGHGRSLVELLAVIERAVGHPVPRRHLPARGIDVPSNVLDIARAQRELGWTPMIGLEEGVARTVEWLRGHRRR
ncbi:MAG: NAD-dependent epimerase/dehydratase family protein [Burkholderiales bacterium]